MRALGPHRLDLLLLIATAISALRKVAAALAGEWGEHFVGDYVPTSGLPLYAAWGFEDVGIFFGAPRRPPRHAAPTADRP